MAIILEDLVLLGTLGLRRLRKPPRRLWLLLLVSSPSWTALEDSNGTCVDLGLNGVENSPSFAAVAGSSVGVVVSLGVLSINSASRYHFRRRVYLPQPSW